MANKIELAWAAGFYEGEGTACHTSTTQVAVYQTDLWSLRRLRRLFGGKVAVFDRKKPGWSPQGQWTCYGDRARSFLRAIYPFLSPKRKRQARAALGRAVRRRVSCLS